MEYWRFVLEWWNKKTGNQDQTLDNFYGEKRKELLHSDIASRPTIRKWLGLNGEGTPGRNEAVALGILFGWDSETMKNCLFQCLDEPGIQINDYSEIIALYAMENSKSLEETRDMIWVFETKALGDLQIQFQAQTKELYQEFLDKKRESPEKFLSWMLQRSDHFKGYSNTAMHYFGEYKNKVLNIVRENARADLIVWLQETDYFGWCYRENLMPDNYKEHVLRYLHNEKRHKTRDVAPWQEKQIRELYWMVYVSKNRNADLLAELFASAYSASSRRVIKDGVAIPDVLKHMSDKRLSQIAGIAHFMEKQIVLRMLFHRVSKEQPDEPCQDEVLRLCEKYQIETEGMLTNQKLQKKLQKILVANKARCSMVGRKDILPMIHYVCQDEYTRKNAGDYHRDSAIQYFTTQANEVLGNCNMALINEKFAIDHYLLSCFKDAEMDSIADHMEGGKK